MNLELIEDLNGNHIKMDMFKSLIWTVIPSYYQSSFHTALRGADVDLKVCYYEKVHACRIEMGWDAFEELPEGEQYVPKSLEALDLVSDWRERINVIPGYGNKLLRDLVKELCRRGVKWVHWSEPSHPGLRWWRSYPVKCWYAKMVNTYALGAFGIGIRALYDFRKWGISAERVAFLPYATAGGDRYVQPDSICETFRGGRKAFVFLGSLIHRKGIDILLRAFAEVATISKDWVLLLVGDDRSRGVYQQLAKSLGIAEKVCFRGSVSAGFIPSVLKAAQVLVLPSRFDGWGIVLNEAASMGLALIGSENAGASFHLIEPGENGFIVGGGSIGSLARAMGSYVRNPELAARHGEHSLKVFEDFTPERNARRFIQAIQSWRAMDSKVYMLVALDAVGIRGHGGAAVLCELLHWLPKVRPNWKWYVFLFDRDLREFDDPPVEGNVSFEHTRNGNSGFARLLWVDLQLQKRLREIKPDVVFSFANIGPVKPSIPQVVFVQQPNAFFNEGIPKREFLRRLRFSFMRWQILKGARASRAVIVQTGAMRKRMLTYVPELNGRIHVIPSGFRTPSLNQVIRVEKKALIDNSSHPRLIYVSHPSEHKNHINLIKALPDVARNFNSVSLLLTLEYDSPNQRYATFVKEIVKTSISLGMGEHLIWLGILTPDEVSYALSNSDLMVFPSIAESFGLGLVEAIAASCSIAASDLPYAHDVARDTAVYFDPLSPKNIAQTIAATLSERDTIERMKAAGAHLKERYSYENIAHQIADVLTSTTLD